MIKTEDMILINDHNECLLRVVHKNKFCHPLEKLEITRLTAHDLQAFLVFSQHPAGAYCAGKPPESVVYCLKIARGRG